MIKIKRAQCIPLPAVQRKTCTELSDQGKKGRGKSAKSHALCYMLYALCIIFIICSGCATAKEGAKASPVTQDPTLITGIDIQNNMLNVTANKPFIYTIYKPGDPYKIVVDLPDVSLGAFNNKIVSQKEGISEITPIQIETPAPLARLEILLSTPSAVQQDYKNNVLTVEIKDDPVAKKDNPARDNHGKENPYRMFAERKEGRPDLTLPEKKQPLSGGSQQKATEISDISFEKTADGAKVYIKGNGTMTPNIFPLDDRLVIDVSDVILTGTIPSTVIPPVRSMRSGKHDDSVRLVLDLYEKTNFDVAAIGDTLVVTLKSSEKGAPSARASQTPDQLPGEKMESSAGPVEIKEPLKYRGEKCESYLEGKENVNFDFQDQDIVPIIRLFADISGCNIFIHPDVRGKATMKFKDVPWDKAFETLLKTFSLSRSVEGNIIRIAPNTVFTREREESVKAKEALVKAEPLETRVFNISYASVDNIKSAIISSKVLTSRGSMNVDTRTSSLIVKDVSSVFPEIDKLLATLDQATPQVLIEARIVEVSTNSLRDLGIQWGVKLDAANTLSSFGGASILNKGSFTGNPFLVDFPSSAAAAGSGGGFNFGLLNPARTMGLDLQIAALESLGRSKIISSPKIVTVDNEAAKIMQGEEIPYPQVTAEGNVSAAFKPVALSVEVTPHITPTNSIMVKILATKEDFVSFVQIGAGLAPRTTKIEGRTNVLVDNGETIVIGGVYRKSERETSNGLPGLMNIPIIGWLFKNKNITEDVNELLIFITPKIVQKPGVTEAAEKPMR